MVTPLFLDDPSKQNYYCIGNIFVTKTPKNKFEIDQRRGTRHQRVHSATGVDFLILGQAMTTAPIKTGAPMEGMIFESLLEVIAESVFERHDLH
jgi:hypothetical protein